MRTNRRSVSGWLAAGIALLALPAAFAMQAHTSTMFSGAKVNGGTVTHEVRGGKHVLTLSQDFKIPDTPAPHWQVVDTQGNVFLLQRLSIKNDQQNRSITLPEYVHDVAQVQIWCAWAETLLGQAAFDPPVK